ncbi:MAG: hypothetical protein C5B49_05090 [Bdellovibrio sp.]|nr:MAG: hypothetical protein C5B49_05090 [Bdellovibrio sp.]
MSWRKLTLKHLPKIEQVWPSRPHTVRLFQFAIYTWALISKLMFLPGWFYFWGQGSLHVQVELAGRSWVWKLLNILDLQGFADYWWIAFLILITSYLLFFLLPYGKVGSAIIFYLSLMNLDNYSRTFLDGGSNLLHLVLFYMIFLAGFPHNSVKVRQSFGARAAKAQVSAFGTSAGPRVGCHFWRISSRWALLMIQLQVAVVYAVAGLTKIRGNLWTGGVALYYVENADPFRNEFLQQLILKAPILTVILTYSIVLFQISFPWMVWFSRTRRYYVFAGTLLHLGIAFGTNLFMFGVTMCLMYLSFCEDGEAKAILKQFEFKPLINWLAVRLNPNTRKVGLTSTS